MTPKRSVTKLYATLFAVLLPVAAVAQQVPPPPAPPPPMQIPLAPLPRPNTALNNQRQNRPPQDPTIASIVAYIRGNTIIPILMIEEPVIAFGNDDLWVAETEVRVEPVRNITAVRVRGRQTRTAVTK